MDLKIKIVKILLLKNQLKMRITILFITLLTIALSLNAQSVNTWIGPDSGVWHDNANWSLGHIPTESEHAYIGGYTILQESAAVAGSIDIRANSNLLIFSEFNISGNSPNGTLMNIDTGSLVQIFVDGALNIDASVPEDTIGIHNGGTLNNIGIININVENGIGLKNVVQDSIIGLVDAKCTNISTFNITATLPIYNGSELIIAYPITTTALDGGYHSRHVGSNAKFKINVDTTFSTDSEPVMIFEYGGEMIIDEDATVYIFASDNGVIDLCNGNIQSYGNLYITFEDDTHHSGWQSVNTCPPPDPIDPPEGVELPPIPDPIGQIIIHDDSDLRLQTDADADIICFGTIFATSVGSTHYERTVRDLKMYGTEGLWMYGDYSDPGVYTHGVINCNEFYISPYGTILFLIDHATFNAEGEDDFDIINYDSVTSTSPNVIAYDPDALGFEHFWGEFKLKIYKEGFLNAPDCGTATHPAHESTGIDIDDVIEWEAVPDALGYRIIYFLKDGVKENVDVGYHTNFKTNKPFYHHDIQKIRINSYGVGGKQILCPVTTFHAEGPTDNTPNCPSILYPVPGTTVEPSTEIRWNSVPDHPFYKIKMEYYNGGDDPYAIVYKTIDYDTIYTPNLPPNISVKLSVTPYYDVDTPIADLMNCNSNSVEFNTGPCANITLAIWDGSHNDDWNNVLNWEGFLVIPTYCHDVYFFEEDTIKIKDDYTAKAHSLSILGGENARLEISGKLNIKSAKNRTALVNTGTLKINTDAELKIYDLENSLIDFEQIGLNNIGDVINYGKISITNFNNTGLYNIAGSTSNPEILPTDPFFKNYGEVIIRNGVTAVFNPKYILNETDATFRLGEVNNIFHKFEDDDRIGTFNNLGSLIIEY